jgi:hypothetical protein
MFAGGTPVSCMAKREDGAETEKTTTPSVKTMKQPAKTRRTRSTQRPWYQPVPQSKVALHVLPCTCDGNFHPSFQVALVFVALRRKVPALLKSQAHVTATSRDSQFVMVFTTYMRHVARHGMPPRMFTCYMGHALDHVVCVCVCVCARARARVCVCVCVCAPVIGSTVS